MKPFPKLRVKGRAGLQTETYVPNKNCCCCNRMGSYVIDGEPGGNGLCLACLFDESAYSRIDLPDSTDFVDQIQGWAERVDNAGTMGELQNIKTELERAARDLERGL